MITWLIRRLLRLSIWNRLGKQLFARPHGSIVEFYDRMLEILTAKGLSRPAFQTPLEFAFDLGMPEAVKITEKYNAVRYGEKHLSRQEADEIENWLERLKTHEIAETRPKTST